jgi:hypothetical protein
MVAAVAGPVVTADIATTADAAAATGALLLRLPMPLTNPSTTALW